MQADEINPGSYTYNELLQQNHALQLELKQMAAKEQYIWSTLVETSRKLQLSSSSIKAAVSSLLNYDIFWDGANQHEFLETINTSIDQVSDMVNLVALESRLEAATLELKCEPHFLQEILSVVRGNLYNHDPRNEVSFYMPEDEKLVEVDYAYLTLALEFLIQAIAFKSSEGVLSIVAEQAEEYWTVTLKGVDTSVVKLISGIAHCNTHPDNMSLLSAEYILKLHIACKIIHLQEIELNFPEENTTMKLVIPVYRK